MPSLVATNSDNLCLGLACEAGVPAPPQHCWCGSLLTTCRNDSMCVGDRCVVRCDSKKFMQKEDCWCKADTAVCEAGQVCEEEQGVCRDVVLCEDPRTVDDWEEMNLGVEEGIEDFIEDTNYTFSCHSNFYLEDYVSPMKTKYFPKLDILTG